LYSLFSPYGNLQSVQIKQNNLNRKQILPSAEVEFTDVASAVLAMKDLDGQMFFNQPLQ